MTANRPARTGTRPAEDTRALLPMTRLRVHDLQSPIYDPCCGRGMILDGRSEYGYEASGSDLVDRGYGVGGVDFLTNATPRQTLICNPPFSIATPFVLHALDVAHEVAVLVKVQFLNSQIRYDKLYRAGRPTFWCCRAAPQCRRET